MCGDVRGGLITVVTSCGMARVTSERRMLGTGDIGEGSTAAENRKFSGKRIQEKINKDFGFQENAWERALPCRKL